MAKVAITNKLVEENSQLAALLIERNFEVGSKIEQAELDGLINSLNAATEGAEGTDVIKETEAAADAQSYVVAEVFADKFDNSILYEVGQEVPADFTEERIKDLLNRNLIK